MCLSTDTIAARSTPITAMGSTDGRRGPDMPEGHTIHRLARDIGKDMKNTTVGVSSPQGRFAESSRAIDGGTIQKTEAAGKHLFVHWTDRPTLHIHLGLIGKFRRFPSSDAIRGEVRLRLEAGEVAWHLSGPQTCRLIDRVEVGEIIDGLGPDPLRRDGHRGPFVEGLAKSNKAVGAILLDQSIIAGIGNVFRAEFLFMLGIHPTTIARTLSAEEVSDIWDLAAELLRVGLRLDRIVTVTPDDSGAARGRLGNDDRLYVYKRDGLPCRRCGTEIICGPVANRTIWWCPTCQPPR